MDERKAKASKSLWTDWGDFSLIDLFLSYITTLDKRSQNVTKWEENRKIRSRLFLSSVSWVTLTFMICFHLFLDWAHREYNHSWVLDSSSCLRRFPSSLPFSESRPNNGCANLRISFDSALLHKHRLSLCFLLQQRSDAEGCSTSNGSSNDLRFHRRFLLSMVELRPHSTSLHRLYPQMVDLGVSRFWHCLPAG